MKIQDYNLKIDCPPESVETADSFLRKKWDFGGNANFAIIHTLGIDKHLQKACHANFAYNRYDGRRICIANENSTTRIAESRGLSTTDIDKRRTYVKWLIQDSFFSRFFLNHDVDFGMEYGFITTADAPSNLLHNLNIMIRYFFERHQSSFDVFHDLVSAGYSPELIFGLAFHTNIANNHGKYSLHHGRLPFKFETDQIHDFGVWHSAWGLWKSVESLQNFMSGEFGPVFGTEEEGTFRHTATTTGGINYCSAPHPHPYSFIGDLIQKNDDLRDNLASSRKQSTTAMVVIDNPFKRKYKVEDASTPHPLRVSFKELTEIVLPFIKENPL